MQYELKTQVIEPQRQTFTHISNRYGEKPASRYLEGSVGVQPRENFHYRPTWDPEHEIYDEDFSVFKLSDPYSYLDPRQYYYAPYVTNRSNLHEAFATSLAYIEERGLLGRMPQEWRDLVAEILLPMRHYESGGQLTLCGMARFAYGSTVTQAAAYAAFDRVGNAQVLSRVGIALGDQTTELLDAAKEHWLEDDCLQELRRFSEETICEEDWALALIRLDAVDQLLYDLFYGHLDDAAITGGAPAYSLLAQHLSGWFADNRKWIDALYMAWREDEGLGETNTGLLAEHGTAAAERALSVVRPIAVRVDELLDVGASERVTARADELKNDVAPSQD